MAAVLVWSTPLRRRIWRFRLVLFLVRMWRLYAPARLMLPLPRTRKRFAAPRLDFIFGIKNSLLLFWLDAGRPCSCAFFKAVQALDATAITCDPLSRRGLCCMLCHRRLGLVR